MGWQTECRFQQRLRQTARGIESRGCPFPVLRLYFYTDSSLYLGKPKTSQVDRHAVSHHTQYEHPPPYGEDGCFLILDSEGANSALTPERYGRLEIQKGCHQKQIDGHHPDPMIFPGQRLHYLRERRVLRPWRRRRDLRRRPPIALVKYPGRSSPLSCSNFLL